MNKLLLIKKSEGFTLVEVLIFLAIFGIVMAVGAAVLIQIFDIIPSTNERMSTRQLAEIDLNKLAAFVRRAKEVDPDNNSITIIEDEIEKVIGFDDNAIKKDNNIIINNVESFKLEKDSDSENLYFIILEKCNTEDCEESVILETQVLLRN